MKQGVNVRALELADAPAYRELMLRGYAQDADAFTSTPEERAAEPMAWWHQRMCDPRGLSQAFGAFHQRTLVGSVAIEYTSKTKTRHKGLIVGMFVLGAHRGLGAGRGLLEAAIAHARARSGVRMLTLTVTQGNARATRLYEAAGFRQFGLEKMAIFTGSTYHAKVHMQLQLAGP